MDDIMEIRGESRVPVAVALYASRSDAILRSK
jgi:hypothetical protein